MTQDRKLLEPLATVVSVGLRLLIGLLLISGVLSVINGSAPLWGTADTCVTADWVTSSSGAADSTFAVREGAHVNAIPQYCAENSDAAQQLLAVLGHLPSLVVLIGGLALLNRLLTSAARDGVHTLQSATRLRSLGWWLLAGCLIAEITEAAAQAALLATMTDQGKSSVETTMQLLSPPYVMILTALGVLTFARITKAGAAMREDLEGVV
ncbi:DUF2975 domain-containing protein [Streptomyces sp. NPDC090021]|uniref:DUF2975 domain-containing protein n=1 Tax=Streptomyces sp. NPDC090021 TaxID=3365919 RepID=UPI00380B6E01